MKQIRIYQHAELASGSSVSLDKVASNHLLRVLRLRQGDEFILFNGNGREYPSKLQIAGKTAVAQIYNELETARESCLQLHLYQGISKGERMDFAIQKAIELGVSEITPLFCERTVVSLKGDRLDKKLQHWQGIAISACEQSGRNHIPPIHSAQTFSQALAADSTQLRLMLEPTADQPLASLQPENNAVSIYIGPEGGFSDNEIIQAQNSGLRGISLGPRILRTETAALAAVTACQLLWGDLSETTND
ncbi:MAG TPA: 16S rRNA (uracil(1498)-N(3))-methyltransferase [Gammaproteobacteria bacterium]